MIFFFLLLAVFGAHEIVVHVPDSKQNYEGFCGRFYYSLSGDTQSYVGHNPMTYDEALAIQEKRMRETYPKDYPHIPFTPEMFDGWAKADRKVPRKNVFYLSLEPEDSIGEVRGWMRAITNWEHPQKHELEHPKENRTTNKNVLPVETKHPGLSEYFDKKFPYRVEIGRLTVDSDVGPGNRQANFVDFLKTFTQFLGKSHPDRKTEVVFECHESKLEMYKQFGFKEITPEEIQTVSKDFKPSPEMHIMSVDLKKLAEYISNLHAGEAPHIARARPRGEEGFKNTRLAIAAGDPKAARAALDELKKRFRNDFDPEEIADIDFRVTLLEKYNFVNKTGDINEAIKYLSDSDTQKKYKNAPAYYNIGDWDISLPQFFLASLLTEAGRTHEATILLNQMREKRKDWVKATGHSTGAEGDAEYLSDLKKEYFDPNAPKKGNARNALEKCNQDEVRYRSLTFSSKFRFYRSQVLNALGQKEAAQREKKIAELLERELAP